MGDLIRMPHSELHATIELLDRLGVTPRDFEVLRKASTWNQVTTARVHKTDPSVWAALELEDAAVREGFTPGELRELAKRKDLLKLVWQALHGRCQGAGGEHLINCDAAPFGPSGLTVASELDQLANRVRGQIAFDPTKIKLHLSPNQQGSKYIKGEKLRKELALACEPVLTAHVLDFLLANPTLIPEEWKEKTNGYATRIFFWGTIYCDARGNLCVRYLYWFDGRWCWSYNWLSRDWHGYDPAALRAS